MARRKSKPTTQQEQPANGAAQAHARGPRVLLVGPVNHALGERLARCASARCATATTVVQAMTTLRDQEYDVVIGALEGAAAAAAELARELLERDASARVIGVNRCPGQPVAQEASLDAMRAGVCDIIDENDSDETIAARVFAATERARRIRRQQRKAERLRKICKRLNSAREEVTQQVDVLCTDLVQAYNELADQVTHVSMASEFASLVRQELDVESLLRTTLEFMLTRTGPTNAAVFLPTGLHDFSLGAYVNFDLPKENADVLLDHLSDSLPQEFEEQGEIITNSDDQRLREWALDAAPWLVDQTVAVFACLHEGECLGVAALFREKHRPFSEDVLGQLRVMRDLFTQQLARVVSVHNRHLSKKDWPGFGHQEDDGDDYGLAA